MKIANCNNKSPNLQLQVKKNRLLRQTGDFYAISTGKFLFSEGLPLFINLGVVLT